MTAEVSDGHLWIGGVDMVELAREAGTALYVMDEATIRHQLSRVREVDARTTGRTSTSSTPARRSCRSRWCKLVAEEGCCLRRLSGGELAFALRAGFPMERIYVHGNNKTPAELAECLDAGVGRIVVDSFEEMERLSAMAAERGVAQKVLLRVTPGIEADTHDFIQTGAEDSQVRLRPATRGSRWRRSSARSSCPGIDFDGLHMHIGSQIFALHSFAQGHRGHRRRSCARSRPRPASRCAMLDTGGGLGIAYGLPDEPSTIKEYGKVVVDGIKEECEKHGLTVPRMAVEPGRAIVANAGVTLYTVGIDQGDPEHPHVRRGRRRHVRQHPHRRSTTRTTRRSSRTRPTSRARWSRRSPASTARAATSSSTTRRCSAPRSATSCACARPAPTASR